MVEGMCVSGSKKLKPLFLPDVNKRTFQEGLSCLHGSKVEADA